MARGRKPTATPSTAAAETQYLQSITDQPESLSSTRQADIQSHILAGFLVLTFFSLSPLLESCSAIESAVPVCALDISEVQYQSKGPPNRVFVPITHENFRSVIPRTVRRSLNVFVSEFRVVREGHGGAATTKFSIVAEAAERPRVSYVSCSFTFRDRRRPHTTPRHGRDYLSDAR